MCLIVDTNTFDMVFNDKNIHHDHFETIKQFVLNGKTKLIVGGRYFDELKIMRKYNGLLALLRSQAKVVYVDDEKVNFKEEEVTKIEPDPAFNDTHVVALAVVSGAKLLCTNDNLLMQYAKDRRFYQRGQSTPSVYSLRTPVSILSDGIFHPRCKSCLG
jgi:predicted nucleic acid-binding protein